MSEEVVNQVSHQIAERSNVRNTQDRIEAALQECSPTLGSQIRFHICPLPLLEEANKIAVLKRTASQAFPS